MIGTTDKAPSSLSTRLGKVFIIIAANIYVMLNISAVETLGHQGSPSLTDVSTGTCQILISPDFDLYFLT